MEPTLRVESCKGLHLGKLQPCIQKLVRLGWEWINERNTLAYYDAELNTTVKRFLGYIAS